MRLFGVALLVIAFAGSAMAENANQRVVGKKGIGYFSSDAPLGVRYWTSDAMAIDFGIGIGLDTKIPNPGNATDETLLDFGFDVGMPWVLHGEDNMIVYFRPGVTVKGNQAFDVVPAPVGGVQGPADKVYDMTYTPNLGLGGEFFLGQLGWPNLSFSGQVGIGLQLTSPGGSGAESRVSFATTHQDVSVVNTGALGFHIYF
jgi:hypothetical protein